MKKIFTFTLISLMCLQINAQSTNNSKLSEIITRVSDTVIGQEGNWRFSINDRLLVCLTDEKNNRMRIISPITEVENLEEKELLNALVANFHTALDVKYAISDEVLWSVFTHPLKELSDAQVEDAILQVYNAAETFGTIYSSTNLSFPGNTKKKERDLTKPKVIKLQKG